MFTLNLCVAEGNFSQKKLLEKVIKSFGNYRDAEMMANKLSLLVTQTENVYGNCHKIKLNYLNRGAMSMEIVHQKV